MKQDGDNSSGEEANHLIASVDGDDIENTDIENLSHRSYPN